MKRHSLIHKALGTAAALALAFSVASCSAPVDPAPAPADSGVAGGPAESSAGAPEPAADGDCGWDAPRLPVTDPAVPSGQEGDLSSVVLGSWQVTHFDLGLGNGMEAWEAGTDVRYVFSSPEELMYCVDGLGGVDRSESPASYALAGTDIKLGNGAAFAAVAWNADAMLLRNPSDESLNLFMRR